MTNYIDDLQDALKEAAALEYPAADSSRTIGRDRRRSPRAKHAGRRATWRVAVLAGVIAAAVFVVANVALSGNHSVVQSAQAKTILRRIRAATVLPAHALYEEQWTTTITARDGATATWRYTNWDSTSPPYNRRSVVIENGKLQRDSSVINKRPSFYSPSTQTIYVGPRSNPQHGQELVTLKPQTDSVLSFMRSLMNKPGVKVDANATLDGSRAIKLTFDGGRFSYWVSPATYRPLQSIDRADHLPDGQAGVGVDRYPVVRVLTGTADKPSLLSLPAQHPGATVNHNKAAYEKAYQRQLGNPPARRR